ncbi:MAG: tetratricopeptide repeat protein [Kofleriaceae bacterium]
MRSVAVIALLVVATTVAEAAPRQELERAISSFKSKDFDSAFKTSNSLLYPQLQFSNPDDTVEAFILLGASLYHLGNRDRAVEEFKHALTIDIERSLTTLMYDPKVVELFEDTKAKLKDRIEADRAKKALADREKQIQDYINTIGVYETHSLGVAFVPFGFAQRQNGHKTKALIVGGAQAAAGITSLGCFFYLATKYGLSAKVPLEDGPRVRRIQQIEITSGAAFFLLWIYTISDGLYYFKPSTRVKGDDSKIRQDLEQPLTPRPKPKKTSFRDRLRIGPILVPTGAGIGIGWETD